MRWPAAGVVSALAAGALLLGCGDDRDVASPEEISKRVQGGKNSEGVVVPTVVGDPRGQARSQLERAGLRVDVTKESSSKQPEGVVLGQRPAGGRRAPRGGSVRIVVSTGAAPPPPAPAKPRGPLGTSAVGPVRVGMSQAQVRQLFGSPDETEEVNFGQGAAPQVDWIWSFADGKLRVQFETQGSSVTGYVCETSTFATVSGARVGGSFAPIRDRFGDQLTGSPIGGPGNYVLSENEPRSFPALMFATRNDTITSISGGEFQPAGE